MYHFQSNKTCYSNTYCRGIIERIISKVRFQGYWKFCDISSFRKYLQEISLWVNKIWSIAKKNGLQCYLTISRCVTILHDNQIDLNENKYLFKDLNEVPSSNDWFPYEYVDDEVNMKLDKTKGLLAGDEMEN